MNTITVDDLTAMVAEALELQPGSISSETSQEDVEEWDSLGHIAILSLLDETFDDITESVPELMETTSIPALVELLKSQGCIG